MFCTAFNIPYVTSRRGPLRKKTRRRLCTRVTGSLSTPTTRIITPVAPCCLSVAHDTTCDANESGTHEADVNRASWTAVKVQISSGSDVADQRSTCPEKKPSNVQLSSWNLSPSHWSTGQCVFWLVDGAVWRWVRSCVCTRLIPKLLFAVSTVMLTFLCADTDHLPSFVM